jgi:hypothetical protein
MQPDANTPAIGVDAAGNLVYGPVGYATTAGHATTADRAFPKRSDGTNIDVVWSGQPQMQYALSSTDGVSFYPSDPSTWRVASAGYADRAGSIIAGGAAQLIGTFPGSNVPSIESTNIFNGYEAYVLEFVNINAAANNSNTANIQFFADGAWQTAGYIGINHGVNTQGSFYNSWNNTSNAETDRANLQPKGRGWWSASEVRQGVNGFMWIGTPHNTGHYTTLTSVCSAYDATNGAIAVYHNAGRWARLSSVTGFRVFMDTGNIGDGVVRVFGF